MDNSKWLKHSIKYGACNVERNYDFYFKFLLSKLFTMIEINGLPDTVDETFTKQMLILNGNAVATKFNDKLYILNGNYGGRPDVYYVPQDYVIANPILGSKVCKIRGEGIDSVLLLNDKSELYFGGGLFQLLNVTATMLADNVVSINTAQINTRVQTIITADSVAQKNSAEIALKKLYGGEPYQVLTNDLISQIGINPINKAENNLTALSELQQFIMAQFYNSLGIKTTPYQKKERMITDEIKSLDGYLGLSIETIYKSWKEGFDKVNEMFGTDIKVKLNPLLENAVNVAEEGPIEVDSEVEVGETEVIKEAVEEDTDSPQEAEESNEESGEETKEREDE